MRSMVLVKAKKDSEAGILQEESLNVAMGKFDEEVMKGGVLLVGEGIR